MSNQSKIFGDINPAIVEIVGPLPNNATPMASRPHVITESKVQLVNEFAMEVGLGRWIMDNCNPMEV